MVVRGFGILAVLSALLTTPAAARDIDVGQATITDINAALTAGTLTSERLVELSLARITAYEDTGPALNAIIALNPNALALARTLDAERKAGKIRGPLHGIPVVLKDNFDTADMPTTGGSVFLDGHMAKQDAFVVKKLRDAGAIILAKLNLSEFATAGAFSSLGGQSKNPHDLTRSPMGSSGGTGVAIAAGYAPLGLGTDTGGSVRLPSSANGITGIRPTRGLLSRAGIIPLSLSFDTAGPMTRSVADLALALDVMAGVDAADAVTATSKGKVKGSFTQFLKPDALKGKRIGLARDFMGADPDVDWAMEGAVKVMEAAGATVVEVRFPKWMLDQLDVRSDFMASVRFPEASEQISAYLAAAASTAGGKYPKSLTELVERGYAYQNIDASGARPNPARWRQFTRDLASGTTSGPRYLAVRDHGLPLIKAVVEGEFSTHKLNAIIYPAQSTRTGLISTPDVGAPATRPGGSLVASITGFPDATVPAGYTGDALPIGLGIVGPAAYTDGEVLGLAYAFEQATKFIRQPIHTPPLPGGTISVP